MRNTLWFTLALLSISPSVYAAGCNCGSVNAIVANHTSQAVSQINANTDMQAEMLKVEINNAARNIIGTLQTQTKSIVSAIQLLKEDIHQTVKSTSVAEELIRVEEIYGDTSQSELLCGGSNVGAGMQIAEQASEILHSGLREKQINYSNNPNSSSIEFIERILADNHPKIEEMVTSMSPVNHTLTAEEVTKANETIKTIAHPFPLPVPTEEQAKTLAGENYTVARTREEGQRALAMDALNHNVAFHSPTLPTDVTAWAQEQWKNAGGTGEVPGLVNGKMSQAGLFALLSQLRSANPNWVANLSKMTEIAVAREQLFIDALHLEIQRKNNELLNRLVVLASLQYIKALDKDTEAKDVYQNMISQDY